MNSTIRFLIPLMCTAAALLVAPQARAQEATLPPGATPPTLTDQRAQVAKELESAKAVVAKTAASGTPVADSLTREVELLTRIDLLYRQVLAAADQQTELERSKAQVETDLQTLRTQGPSEERPYRFMLLESLRDQLSAEIGRGDTLGAVIQSAQDALAAAKNSVEEKETARRKAQEALDTNRDESARPSLGIALRFAQLESQVAAVQVTLREQELANNRIEQGIHADRVTFLKEKIDLVVHEVRFRRQGLDEILAQLDEEEFKLNKSLDQIKPLLSLRDTAWANARAQLDSSPTKDTALVEEVGARSDARQAVQREIATLGKQLQYVAEDKTVWQRRYQTFNLEIDAEQLRVWDKETNESLAQLERDIRRQTAELAEFRKSGVAIDAKLAAPDGSTPEVRRWLDEQKRQLASLARVCDAGLARAEASQRLRKKLLAEMGDQIATVTWSERLRGVWDTVKEVWGYELTSIQDHPITVSKVVVGLILLLFGTFASRFVAQLIGGRFLPRFGLNEGASAAIQSLLFYLLVLTVVMVSLRIVNVPLTAFTILGGALAIGIGFGSQNVANNFISGLILLTERPIRVGDLIQIDELTGTVQHIGPRSTRVRSPENMDIIVPNSSFVEKNVVNWTLSDDRCRTKIVVGVVYGSNTREATKLLRKAVEEHGKVLDKPEPIILFSDFGDNALTFEVHFWVRMRRIMDRRIIESDIRYKVDGLFREAGIVIAFPQRDVHFDSLRPIEVLLRRDDATDADAAEDKTSKL